MMIMTPSATTTTTTTTTNNTTMNNNNNNVTNSSKSSRKKVDPPAMETPIFPTSRSTSNKSSPNIKPSSSHHHNRDRHGRRPSNYTASYTPPASLVKQAQEQRARAAAAADVSSIGQNSGHYHGGIRNGAGGSSVAEGSRSSSGGGDDESYEDSYGAYDAGSMGGNYASGGVSVSSNAASFAGSYASMSYASVGGGSAYYGGGGGYHGYHHHHHPRGGGGGAGNQRYGRHRNDQDSIAEERPSPPRRRNNGRHVQEYYPTQAPSSPNSTQACPSVAPSVYSQYTQQTFQSTQSNHTSQSYQTYHTTQTNHTNNTSNTNHTSRTNKTQSTTSTSATIKHQQQQQLTEQQIAEYAGKRALLRLEQEFLAENPNDHSHNPTSPNSASNSSPSSYNRNAGLAKQRSHSSLMSRNSAASEYSFSGAVSIASTHTNHTSQTGESSAMTSQYQPKVISVMDRKKLARVPQVNKRDLVIGEYLGRGNFCDVFEVTWVLENDAVINTNDNGVGKSRRRSSSNDGDAAGNGGMNRNESDGGRENHDNDDEEDDDGSPQKSAKKQMEALSLSCSNDLRPVFDLGQRRSISQISTTPQTNRYRAAGRGDAILTNPGGLVSGNPSSDASIASNAASTNIRNPNILALKCLRPAVRANPRKFVIGAEDLAHETALLACLDHPNIIQLHGRAEGCFSTAFQFGTSSSSNASTGSGGSKSSKEKDQYHEGYFIILDRLVGTLSDRIDEWKNECRAINGVAPSSLEIKLSETTLREHLYKRLKAAYCVADALEYLHSRNVVYRDLKPQNIGIDCYDCVKIFDFGFATSLAPFINQPKKHGSYGPLTETCGTRRYMAPEVALKLGYGKEVDVYSFGMLLWEICAMEKPFDSIQSVEAFHDMVVLCGKRPSLHLDPLWTSSLKGLMSRCWSTDPLDRPTMAQVKNMLCNVLRDMNVSEIERAKRMSGRGGAAEGARGDDRKRGGGGNQGDQQQQQGGQSTPFFNKLRRRLTM